MVVPQAWNDVVQFCGFIELNQTKEHQSATCIVFRGRLTRDHHDMPENEEVVVKMMKERAQFRREIDGRAKGNRQEIAVVPIISSSDDQSRWAEDAKKRGYGEYRFGIVMKAAQRNLMVILVRCAK